MEISKAKKILLYGTLAIVAFYFLFLSLSRAQPFLAPFITAVILALVVLPLSQKMEKKISRPAASLVNTLLLFLISVGFIFLVSFQVKSFAGNWREIKDTMKPKIEQVKTYLYENTPLKQEDFQSSEDEKKSKSLLTGFGMNSGRKALSFVTYLTGFLGTYLLTFIYVFFLLNYRRRFKRFLLRLFPDEKKEEVKNTITHSAKVAPQYLAGKLMLMGLLGVLYSIGLGLSGVNNFILVSIIAALLTLIPYIGNMIGILMALAFGYLTSGDTMVLVGIIITFTVAQFVESYILQPYVVGDRVDVHPFWVIVVVIIGNLLWGVIGMILAIPVMAILTVLLLHIKALRPYGLLFSKKEIKEE